ncbi:MAG: hypothetical protein WAV95_11995 [Azonexus sp.]
MIDYALAGPADEAILRQLLRDHPMPSWVAMAMTREPDFFAGANRFGRDWAVLAREGNTPVGMYNCAEQPVHVDGQPGETSYLGALRVAPAYRHRLRVLRDGYASIRRLSPQPAADLWYTAVASENRPARRLLEAGLRGMPHYEPLNELVTLALPSGRGRRHGFWQAVTEDRLDGLCRFYNEQARAWQFSPALTPEIACRSGAGFHVVERDGAIVASMALWNQQAYKQVVACAYRWPLGPLLPAYNLYARCAGRLPLPPVGRPLDQSALAFFAVAPVLADAVPELIEDALARCPTAALSFALHAGHPWLAGLLRHFRPATYRSWIYAVSFAAPASLDGRPAQPEAAVL